jgi:hypothetical protein
MNGTIVDPGDLEDFAKRVREIDKDWTESNGAPQKVLRVAGEDWGYPRLGEFEEAGSLREQYNAARSNMARNFNELHALLEGLADGSEKIAERYRSAEDLNRASVNEIDRILGEEMPAPQAATGQPGQSPPAGTQTPPQAQA